MNIEIKNKNNVSLSDIIINKIRKEQLKNKVKLDTKYKKDDIKFIHITKTAGTTIENIGNEHGYNWGRFDKNYLENFNKNLKFDKFSGKSIWHIPLQYFKTNPYKNKILFTIVRNPYKRCVSEYYCPWTGNKNKHANIQEFNKWIQNKLTQNDILSFLPYNEYFSYNDKIIINYILYFENLEQEFNNLFKNIKLDRYDNKSMSFKKYDINNLNETTIKMINDKYHKDFILFKYKMIT